MQRNCEGEMIHLYESLWERDTVLGHRATIFNCGGGHKKAGGEERG